MTKAKLVLCPCHSNKKYRDCCEPYHQGLQVARHADVLMRTRYSAYALNLINYIRATWAPETCPDDLTASEPLNWIELIIKQSYLGQQADEAFVEFIAKYRSPQGKAEKLHEIGRFIKRGQTWWYLDGQIK